MSVQIGAAEESALERARGVVEVLRSAAGPVDRAASFPGPSIAAVREAGLLAAAAPRRLSGPELGTAELAAVGRVFARGCSSTAMVWAMHQVQIACLARHGGTASLDALLDRILRDGGLIASVTSEAGVGGDLRRSRVACEAEGGVVALRKEAPTISYGAQASGFLITARRSPEAAEGDQVLVSARKEQTTLEQRASWETMGMRGTCSPPFLIEATVGEDQILPDPFGEIAALTMVPLSHILWSAVWIGTAEEALARATACLRGKRGQASHPGALVGSSARLQTLDALLGETIDRYEGKVLETGAATREFGILVNNLKLAASRLTVEIAVEALEVCGMAGYAENGPASISRLLRDLFSARLMISNSRLAESNSASLLLERYP